MKQEIYLCVKYAGKLCDMLEASKIRFERSSAEDQAFGFDWITFTVDAASPEWPSIEGCLDTCDVLSEIRKNVYSEDELECAEWLHIAAMCLKVEDGGGVRNFDICENKIGGICYARTRHPNIVTTKPIKWTKRHAIYGGYEFGYDEIFCNEDFAACLQAQQLPVHFVPVYHARTQQTIPNLLYLQPDIVLPLEAVDLRGVQLQSDCPVCGRRTYMLQECEQISIYRRFLDNVHGICATPRIWGPGGASPTILISQNVFGLLKAKRLLRGVRLTPVIIK